jgi:hypothetical protein
MQIIRSLAVAAILGVCLCSAIPGANAQVSIGISINLEQSGNVSDIFTVYGYSAAQTMVAVLKQCGDDLTRENVMKQAASIHDLKLPMLLPGITVSTSADDFAPIKQMQLMKFDGTTWRLFGDVISASSP